MRKSFQLPTVKLSNVNILEGEFDYEIIGYQSQPTIKHHLVINMEHLKLYELKIEELEKENKDLKQKLEKQDSIKNGYKEEISKWNKKYKDLKNQIKNG